MIVSGEIFVIIIVDVFIIEDVIVVPRLWICRCILIIVIVRRVSLLRLFGAQRQAKILNGFLRRDRESLLTNEFENGEEEADHLRTRAALEDLSHRHGLRTGTTTLALQSIDDVRLVQFDGRVVEVHFMFAEAIELHRLDDALERFEEIHDLQVIHLDLGVLIRQCVHGRLRDARAPAGVSLFPLLAAILQCVRRIAVRLVLEEILDELHARREFVAVRLLTLGGFALGGLGVGDEAGLQLQQRRGGHEKLARHLDVHPVDVVEKCDVLVRDLGNGDLGNVDFRLPNEVQQQVQRTFK